MAAPLEFRRSGAGAAGGCVRHCAPVSEGAKQRADARVNLPRLHTRHGGGPGRRDFGAGVRAPAAARPFPGDRPGQQALAPGCQQVAPFSHKSVPAVRSIRVARVGINCSSFVFLTGQFGVVAVEVLDTPAEDSCGALATWKGRQLAGALVFAWQRQPRCRPRIQVLI